MMMPCPRLTSAKPLVLRDERAGERDEAVGEPHADQLQNLRVDPLGHDHLLVIAHCPEGEPQVGPEEEVEQNLRDEREGDEEDQQRPLIGHEGEPLGERGEDRHLPQQRQVRPVAEHADVDRVEHRHREDAREEVGNVQLVVDRRGDHPRDHACGEGDQHGDYQIHAVGDEDRHHRGAERERAIDGQIRKVQDPKGDEDTERHRAVDESFDEDAFDHRACTPSAGVRLLLPLGERPFSTTRSASSRPQSGSSMPSSSATSRFTWRIRSSASVRYWTGIVVRVFAFEDARDERSGGRPIV